MMIGDISGCGGELLLPGRRAAVSAHQPVDFGEEFLVGEGALLEYVLHVSDQPLVILTQGLPDCLIAGKRMTLSTQMMSGFTSSRTRGRSFSAQIAVSTIASQQSLT